MQDHVLRFIGAVFLTILALLGIGSVLHILVTLPLEGKGPEWVGAIGTVATLIGTIHLARTETRRRERQERLNACIYATLVRPRVRDAWVKIRSITEELHPLNANKEPDNFVALSRQLDEIVLCTHEELVALSAHPSGIARKLAIAALQIKKFAPVVHYHSSLAKPETREALATALGNLSRQGAEIEPLLLAILRDCEAAETELERGID